MPTQGQELTEVGHETNVVALHDDTRRDDHAPRDGLWVQPHALPQRHGPLLLGRRLGAPEDRVRGVVGGVVLGHVRRLLVRHVVRRLFVRHVERFQAHSLTSDQQEQATGTLLPLTVPVQCSRAP